MEQSVSRIKNPPKPSQTGIKDNENEVDIVDTYKYLGTLIDDK